ncbi:hypothetical protein NM688_g5444 [Phlebia brevispora]|uniref:Uncharacterized protein n=1 Tax=Phlebia brevispora TaxID=194682 RepID=A0ACC1SVP4_9APHY|nr:hypothetical protein NM688_g5444 [Phlebia brevispora]
MERRDPSAFNAFKFSAMSSGVETRGEGASRTQLQSTRLSSSSKSRRKDLSSAKTPLTRPSNAGSGGGPPPPSGSDTARKDWTCRYLEREKDGVNFDEIQWEHIEPLIDSNAKPENRPPKNYWVERWNDQRRRITEPEREVTVYADEQLKDNAKLEIRLQIKHATTNPVIPSSLADQPCADLGVPKLLNMLNKVLRTSYSADTPGLSLVLEQCIKDNYDFGTAFGRLRQFWFYDFTGLPARLAELERTVTKRREDFIDRSRGLVTNKYTATCRIWDLFSNRVLPIWVTGFSLSRWWAVSHSWTREDQRHNVATSINGFQWPVPIPKDVTLDRIRVELLNLGAEYVWLDVLATDIVGDGTRE